MEERKEKKKLKYRENNLLKRLKGNVPLSEIRHKGLNHSEHTSWTKFDGVKSIYYCCCCHFIKVKVELHKNLQKYLNVDKVGHDLIKCAMSRADSWPSGLFDRFKDIMVFEFSTKSGTSLRLQSLKSNSFSFERSTNEQRQNKERQ
jgi:hypothetical protein